MDHTAAEAVVTADPGAALERAFRMIHDTRMRDMPIVNEALRVEAIGFRRWSGFWLGALVTPWFINLMLLPDQPASWPKRRVGEKQTFAFPAGRFEFIAGREPSFGEYLSCSLFSPVFDFADHETAKMVAEMSLAGLFDEANFEVPDMRVGARPQTMSHAAQEAAEEAERAALEAQTHAQAAPAEHADQSRRDFLRGRWQAETK